MSRKTAEAPNGSLIAPPGQVLVPKGSEIRTGIPPAMDLDETARLVEGPMLALCGVVRSDDPDQHALFQYVLAEFILPELAARAEGSPEAGSRTGAGGALVVFPAEAPSEPRVLLDDEVRVRTEAHARHRDTRMARATPACTTGAMRCRSCSRSMRCTSC